MKTGIKFRLHAFSDAAGKYNPDAFLNGNEDNFHFDTNLGKEGESSFQADVVQDMGPLGIIMAVCDGMGGMNAGEVASEIAVNTIKDFFSPARLTADKAADHESRKRYLEKLIIEADKRVKADSTANPEHEGMGSTIILAWAVGKELTVSWCGDSRAYRFNPAFGLRTLSEDHSYVQELVQKGILTYEQTFEHPQGNIVTRSLGDVGRQAEPETRFYDLYDGDIILLCSDGLSGVLRDRRTPDGQGGYFQGENLEDIIGQNRQSLIQCREALFAAAERADWYDNVTAILCEICSGAGPAPDDGPKDQPLSTKTFWSRSLHLTPKTIVSTVVIILIALAFIVGCFFCYRNFVTPTPVDSLQQSPNQSVLTPDPPQGAPSNPKEETQNPKTQEPGQGEKTIVQPIQENPKSGGIAEKIEGGNKPSKPGLGGDLTEAKDKSHPAGLTPVETNKKSELNPVETKNNDKKGSTEEVKEQQPEASKTAVEDKEPGDKKPADKSKPAAEEAAGATAGTTAGVPGTTGNTQNGNGN